MKLEKLIEEIAKHVEGVKAPSDIQNMLYALEDVIDYLERVDLEHMYEPLYPVRDFLEELEKNGGK